MKLKLVLLSSMFAGLSAVAASRYECGNVGGTEEWRVSIDLNRKVASFFDNDSTVYAKLVNVKSLETVPAQWQYLFEGPDHNEKFRVTFNSTRLRAFVTLHAGKRTEKSLQAEDGCRAVH